MNNITIGIPRSLLYYRYKFLWTSFFKELGVNILLSPYTDQEIYNKGKNITNNKLCTLIQIYIGHVNYLIDKADYILITRINNEDSCPYYNFLYDIINNIFDCNILDFNIDKYNNEEQAFINIAEKLGYSKQVSLNAYKIAKREEYKQRKINYLLQQRKLKKDGKKLLLISKDYICSDEYVKNMIINPKNIDFFDPNNINPDIKSYKKAFFNNIKNLKRIINKTVIITTKPCVLKNNEFNVENGDLLVDLDDKNIRLTVFDYINKEINNE